MNIPSLSFEKKKALAELKGILKKVLDDRLIIFSLYGSKAKGDYETGSDTDIAIIVRGLSHEEKKEIINMIADIEVKYLTPLSAIVLSKEEFEFLEKRERRIALDIEREGMPL